MLTGSIRDGKSRDQVVDDYERRFDSKHARAIPRDTSPALGPESAKVTLIEFADFQCPACARQVKVFDKLLADFPNDVRLVFKLYPLPRHARAEPAARAGWAAHQQGKFWPMHHKLFENQTQLSDADFETYAKDVGLDIPKFKTDFASNAARVHVQKDLTLGDDLGVSATPSLFINGRAYDFDGDLTTRIRQEIEGAP